MKQNMGNTDRIIRSILGLATLLIAIFVTSGVIDVILYIFAGIMIITSIIGVCPIYMPFNISTKR